MLRLRADAMQCRLSQYISPHLHNVGIEVEVVLEALGQVLQLPVVADLGHGDDALDADAVRIHRVDDGAESGAAAALNLK